MCIYTGLWVWSVHMYWYTVHIYVTVDVYYIASHTCLCDVYSLLFFFKITIYDL